MSVKDRAIDHEEYEKEEAELRGSGNNETAGNELSQDMGAVNINEESAVEGEAAESLAAEGQG